MRLLPIIVLTWCVSSCPAQEPGSFDNCRLEGKTKVSVVQALNRLKNRTVAPLKTDVNPGIPRRGPCSGE